MTVFTYSRVPAFNPNTSPVSLARSAAGSVYDIGDTGFTTPLNLTLVATNTVTTSLLSDANGMFPDFTLVDRTSVVFKSGANVFVLTTTTPVPGPEGPPGADSTVPGPPTTDASLLAAGTVADARLPARLQDAALSATILTQTTPKLDKTEAAATYATKTAFDAAVRAIANTGTGGIGSTSVAGGIVGAAYSTGYGVTAAGVPYFDTAGASIGEEAILTPDPASASGLSLIKIGG
jgi:hypothetical protein